MAETVRPLARSTEWSEIRFASPLVTVMRITCALPRSGPSSSYHVANTWLGLPLDGVFTVHARRDDHLIHPGVGVVFPRGIDYRMSHPTNEGDTSVALGFRPGLVDEALPNTVERVRVTRVDLRMRHVVGVLLAALERRDDQLLVDQIALELLGAVAAQVTPARPHSGSATAREKVERIRQVLAERPEARWTLDALARLVGYSPFYLAHQFRALTGTSVHRYLADLRLVAALQRIEAGDASLATLAVDLGFSHHSHLTATLRRRLGLTPRMVRERLRQVRK
jgi:AraC family transcriptional regulator